MPVAAVDIGTNTILLLIAERRGGELVALEERATITRLGQGVDATRSFHPEALARTGGCLTSYAHAVREYGCTRIDVVGTSAVRDVGGNEIAEIVRRCFGVDLRVLKGEEEGCLTFAGALSGLNRAGCHVMFDIGGGSTEVVVGDADSKSKSNAVAYTRSFDVGSVRMTERHVRSDPPSCDDLSALRANLRQEFEVLPDRLLDYTRVNSPGYGRVPVGIAGTMTTLAALSLELSHYDAARVHGHTLTRDALESLACRLSQMSAEARRELPALEPMRADVIVAGAWIACAILERLSGQEVVVSDRGLRWGLAESLAPADETSKGRRSSAP